MAWLYTLFILMLAQVLRSVYTTDNVTVHLQLNSYKYNGGVVKFKSPLFMILVDEDIGVCEEDYHHRLDGDFTKFNGTPTQNSTAPSAPVIQYSGGKMVYLLPRQNYSKALHLIVKQKFKNKNILPGADDPTYYCSIVTTDDLVSPFNLTLQSHDCSACSINVTMVAKCPQNYFNAQCNVYCLPSDNDTSGHYTCGHEGEKICLLGYDGENCTINIPDCVNVTCHNGTCIDLVANFSCSCNTGFAGEFCEHNIDDCVKDACQHGGKCVDGFGNYTCSCANGFDGLRCEHNIDDCTKDTCRHGGTCHDGIGNYTCSCVNGFDGLLCEHNINDCVNITCQNGGTCLDGIMNYTCSCVNGFVGINCQLHLTTESTTSQPKSTSNLERTLSTHSRIITTTPKFNREHASPTYSSLPPKVDNESSPQKAVAIAPIAGGAAGGVLVLVIVVVLVVKCRGKQPRQESHKSQLQRENTFVSYDSTNGVDLQSNDHHNSLYQQKGQNGTALYHEDEKTQL